MTEGVINTLAKAVVSERILSCNTDITLFYCYTPLIHFAILFPSDRVEHNRSF